MNQQEIAKHFRISQATVSIALTQPHSSRISRRLRDEILEYCRRNAPGYLRKIHTWDIGFLGHDNYCSSPFYSELFSGVEEAADKLGYMLFFKRIESIRKDLGKRYFDGIIDARRDFEGKEKLPGYVPRVLLNHAIDDTSIDSVMPDNSAVINTALRHLLETGHRKIGFFIYHFTDREIVMDIHMRERADAFLNLCGKYRISPEYCWTIRKSQKDQAHELLAPLIHECVEHDSLPEAFIISDSTASALMHCLREENLSVPKDVSIVGWDNLDRFSTLPFMTSVDFNFRTMGRIAMEILHERIEDPDAPHRRINVEPRLIIRDSVRKQ